MKASRQDLAPADPAMLIANAVSDQFEDTALGWRALLDKVVGSIQEIGASQDEAFELPFTIQSRLKVAESLRNKIHTRILRLNRSEAPVEAPSRSELDEAILEVLHRVEHDPAAISTLTMRDVLRAVPDLAGVRLLTFDEESRGRLLEGLDDAWCSDSDSPFDMVKHDVELQSGSRYHAIHLRVTVNSNSELTKSWNIPPGVVCEVQVTTLLQYVLNESEHIFRYKPRTSQDKVLKAITEENLQSLEDVLSTGQKRVDRLMRALKEDVAIGNASGMEGGGGTGLDGDPDESPSRTRRANVRALIMANGALRDGQLLYFRPPSKTELKWVRDWATATADKDDDGKDGAEKLLTATWSAADGKLRWRHDPSVAMSISTLAAGILSGALAMAGEERTGVPRYTEYWWDSERGGKSLVDLSTIHRTGTPE